MASSAAARRSDLTLRADRGCPHDGRIRASAPSVVSAEAVGGRRQDEAASAFSRLVGVSFGEILGHGWATLPSSSMRKADRTMPMYFLPYMERSPQAPKASATAWSS